MRTLVMVVGVVLLVGGSGCGRKRVVVVPNTPDGLACQRECLQVFHSCQGGRGGNAKVCAGEQGRCLETCPGAMFSDGRPAIGTYGDHPPNTEPAAAYVPVLAPRAKCRAEDLPEWQGAGAVQKRDLLAKCLADPVP